MGPYENFFTAGLLFLADMFRDSKDWSDETWDRREGSLAALWMNLTPEEQTRANRWIQDIYGDVPLEKRDVRCPLVDMPLDYSSTRPPRAHLAPWSRVLPFEWPYLWDAVRCSYCPDKDSAGRILKSNLPTTCPECGSSLTRLLPAE